MMESMWKPRAKTAERFSLINPRMDWEEFERDGFPEAGKSSFMPTEKMLFRHLHCDFI